MTYGPILKWRFPVPERIQRIKPTVRTVFIFLCAVLSVVFILFQYYSTSPVHNLGNTNNNAQTYVVNNGIVRFPIIQNKSALLRDRIEDTVEISEDILVEGFTNKLEITEEVNHVEISETTLNSDDSGLVRIDQERSEPVRIDQERSEPLGIHQERSEPFDLDQESEEEDADYEDSQEYSEEVVSETPRLVRISPDRGDSQIAGFQWNDTRLDLLNMHKPEYDTKFKNPCWYERLETSTPYENNVYATISPSAKRVLGQLTELWEDEYTKDEPTYRLRCLPYFMIIGQPKCGTTDLFWKIAKHPDILTPPIKELHWWSRSRQGRRFSYSKIIPFEDYVDMFDDAGITIEQSLLHTTNNEGDNIHDSLHTTNNEGDDIHESLHTTNNEGDNIHDSLQHLDASDIDDTQAITGEASVSLFWDNGEWMKYPENWGQSEPTYIVPHYIHHIMPNVKMILMLRDPVERMYSDYLYFHSTNKSAEDFHSAVVLAVDLYTKCMATYSVRKCIYDTSLANKVRVRLRVGMYSAYLKDWLKLFPLEQFYTLRLEDYSSNPVEHIEKIYDFLQMRALTKDEQQEIMVSPVSNVRKAEDKQLGGMLAKTRQILTMFYKPFNIEVSELLEDKKYLWANVL